MNALVKSALIAVVNGKSDLGTLKVLQDNGCPITAVLACGPVLAKLANGQMLPATDLESLKANGVDLATFIGIKPKAVETAPAPTAPAPAATVTIPTGVTETGHRVLQEVKIDGDPFAFILDAPKGATPDERKARRSLYNSFVSRAQSKILEGYRNALKASGIDVDNKTVSEATRDARASTGLDKMLDGVLSKKGFRVNRQEQDNALILAFRDALGILGVTINDAKHADALEAGRNHSAAFADRAITGLKARGLTLAV